jgi:two-component system nitrogen regulation response regulator GlnG
VPDFATLVDRAPARADLRADGAAPPAPAGSADPAESPAARKRLTDLSEADVLAAMEANDWYIQAAAHALGVSRPSMYKLLEAHTQIRRPEHIDADLIRETLAQSGGDVELCAGLLKTPSEALRRHLRVLGI